jgi:hypothetical protein
MAHYFIALVFPFPCMTHRDNMNEKIKDDNNTTSNLVINLVVCTNFITRGFH